MRRRELPARFGELNRWLEWEHGVCVAIARRRLAPVDLEIVDRLTGIGWQDALAYALDKSQPRTVLFSDNVMEPRPEWRPRREHIVWPQLVLEMAKAGYMVEKVVTVDAWHRRLFLRTPKWSHAGVAVVTLLLDAYSMLVVPWQDARHTAWRFRAK